MPRHREAMHSTDRAARHGGVKLRHLGTAWAYEGLRVIRGSRLDHGSSLRPCVRVEKRFRHFDDFFARP
jgi:hypothetical protein